MTSITPMISMKPSATRANNSPSASPLTRCGPSVPIMSMVVVRARASPAQSSSWGRYGRGPSRPPPKLLLVGRGAVVRRQLAVLHGLGVTDLRGLGPRRDLEVVGLVRRLVVARGEVHGLLHVVRLGID